MQLTPEMRRLIHGSKAPQPSPASASFAALFFGCDGLELTPEFKFHPKRKWRFDFACEPARVAVEIEGGTWAGRPCPVCKQRGGGRHNRAAGFARDCEKYREAAFLGWLVFRFPSEQVTAVNVRRLAEFCRERIHNPKENRP